MIISNFLTQDIIFSLIKSTDVNENVLSNEEIEKFDSFKSPKRQLQFFLGRYSAKIAIFNKDYPGAPNFKDITIENGASGEPLQKNNFISITHAHDIAASIIFPERNLIGIDIEFFDEKFLNFQKFIEPCFLDTIKDATISMSMKEAMSKAVLTGFKLPIKNFWISHFQDEGICICEFKNYEEYTGYALVNNVAVLSLVFKKSIALNKNSLIQLFNKFKNFGAGN